MWEERGIVFSLAPEASEQELAEALYAFKFQLGGSPSEDIGLAAECIGIVAGALKHGAIEDLSRAVALWAIGRMSARGPRREG